MTIQTRFIPLIALAIPVVALAVMVPRIVSVALRWDPTHFASAEVMAQGGIWTVLVEGDRVHVSL